jgi:MerR family mercuric resistance operon transcriptional regulator
MEHEFTEPQRMTIAELGRRSGVGVETVRYYQRLGLVSVPPPRGRSHRRYGQDALAELGFVRRCKALGLSLREVATLVDLRRAKRRSCDRLHEVLAALVENLTAKKSETERQLRAARALQRSCGRATSVAECGALARLGTS